MLTLSLQQVVRNAVEAQQHAAECYQTMAERAQDAAARRFFEDLVRVGWPQRAESERAGRKLLDERLLELADSVVCVVESAPEWKGAGDVDMEHAFEASLECETRATLFHDAVADQVFGEEARFFRKLARAEEQRARMLHQALLDLRSSQRAPLTLGQAVRNAITAERTSAAFYRSLSSRVAEPSTKQFFLDLVGVEHLQATEIERMCRSLLQAPLSPHAGIQIESVQAAPGWGFGADLDVFGAMYLALGAERHASRYYLVVASHLDGKEAEFFHALSRTEQTHADLILDAVADRIKAAA